MDNVQFYILAGLGVISSVLCVVLLMKIKNVTYLLEQPVVKKISPALKLKPVKVDEIDEQARRNDRNAPNGIPVNRSNGGRPEGDRGDRGPGDRGRSGDHGRDRGPRPEREMGDRAPRAEGDRGPRPERGDRGDRFGGRDRGRDGRGDRHDRHGGDRNRGPADRGRPGADSFSGERPAEGGERPALAPRAEAPRDIAPRSEGPSHEPVLSPRRPLPSTVDQETEHKEIPAVETSGNNSPMNDASVSDPLFGQADSDIQHGRRNQLKKKPRFDVAAEDTKETPEELKA